MLDHRVEQSDGKDAGFPVFLKFRLDFVSIMAKVEAPAVKKHNNSACAPLRVSDIKYEVRDLRHRTESVSGL